MNPPPTRDLRVKKEYRYKVARGIPTSLVDAAPYRDHLARVIGLGWTLNSLEHLGPVSHQTYRLLLKDRHSALERKTAAAIAALPYSLAVPAAFPDEVFVPAEGAVRRIRALLALGWTRGHVQAEITKRAPGISVAHLTTAPSPRIKAGKWRAVAAVYDELHMTVGPSSIGRTRARKAGHLPPLAWDDIDDPDETPSAWHYIPTDRADAIRDLADMGHGVTEVCRRLHIGREALEKWAARNGMSETFRLLVARETAVFEHRNQHTREAS